MADKFTRRRFLVVGCLAAVTGLAGCSDGGNGGAAMDTATPTDEPIETETSTESTTRAAVTVSGQIVDSEGAPVTVGQAVSLGPPEGLVDVAPDSEGRFELELTGGNPYTFQYTRGVDGYPADGLPDCYTIGQDNPTGATDLGTIELPEAIAVDLTVETADGEDVTEDASVSVSHAANDAASGFELLYTPAELTGRVEFAVTYDGAETTEVFDITGERSVTVTVA